MRTDHRTHHFIAAAVLWRGDEILLVEQQGRGDTVSTWFYRRQPNNYDELHFAGITK